MKVVKNISLRIALAAAVLFTAASCTDDQELVQNEAAPAVAEEAAPVATGEMPSLTVSGAFVEYTEESACESCTFVVPEGASVVDGAKEGIKPGAVICLKSTFKYSNSLEFVNVQGEAGKPVTIATCE
jgi:hypothetical protein